MNKIIKNLVPVIVCCILGLIFYLLFSFAFGSNETKVNQRTDSSSKQAASKQTKQKKKIRLVALGDSLTQGVGDTTNKGGYIHLIQEKLKKNNKLSVATENFGKAGDRSDQILERLKKKCKYAKAVKQC